MSLSWNFRWPVIILGFYVYFLTLTMTVPVPVAFYLSIYFTAPFSVKLSLCATSYFSTGDAPLM